MPCGQAVCLPAPVPLSYIGITAGLRAFALRCSDSRHLGSLLWLPHIVKAYNPISFCSVIKVRGKRLCRFAPSGFPFGKHTLSQRNRIIPEKKLRTLVTPLIRHVFLFFFFGSWMPGPEYTLMIYLSDTTLARVHAAADSFPHSRWTNKNRRQKAVQLRGFRNKVDFN